MDQESEVEMLAAVAGALTAVGSAADSLNVT